MLTNSRDIVRRLEREGWTLASYHRFSPRFQESDFG
jgi:hypothetical protein